MNNTIKDFEVKVRGQWLCRKIKTQLSRKDNKHIK